MEHSEIRTTSRPSGKASPNSRRFPKAVFLTALLICGMAAVLSARGWNYYRLPLSQRPDFPLHHQLRPSGTWGYPLGYAGAACIFLSLLYVARKRLKGLKGVGRMKRWLNVHITLAVLGSTLILFHTAFIFSGFAGLAFWSMVVIVLSGVVGRYIYAQIPWSIREGEVGLRELEGQNAQIRRELEGHLGQDSPLLSRIDDIGRFLIPSRGGGLVSLAGVLVNDLIRGFEIRRLRRALQDAGHHDRREVRAILRLSNQKALLVRRITFWDAAHRLFAHWHILHVPLTFIMLTAMVIHIFVVFLFA